MYTKQVFVPETFYQLLATADLAPAWVGVESISAGTPSITVIFPKKNRFGVGLAEINRALRGHHIVLYFLSSDERESFKFLLNKSDVELHSPRKKKRSRATINKV